MRMAPPDLPGAQTVYSPLDRALALLLAGEREAALRWSAAVVQQDASVPSALILTCRLLADAGRTEAAIEGFELGVNRAIDTGNLPLAVAALGDLRALGVDVSPLVRKKGAATIPVDALVRLRASRPRRVRVGLEWRANGAREWLSPPRIEELPAGLVRDVHIDAPVPPALDGKTGLALRFLVEDAATGRVLVDETHAVAAAGKPG